MHRRHVLGLSLAAAGSLASRKAAVAAQSRVPVAPGVELRLVRAGPDNTAAPLVFIPGWSTGADIWRAQMERFGRDRPVISFDPRSLGRSTVVASGNTPEQRAEDLHVLLNGLGLRRPPVLVGWSQGVQDLAAYIDRYGVGDVAGLVLVDAAIAGGAARIAADPQAAASQFRLLDIYVKHQRDYLQGMMGAIIRRPQAPGLIEALVETGMATPPSIGAAMLVADLYGADRTAALQKMTCPTLVIASAISSELELQRAAAQALPSGRLAVIEDAGHAVFIDQPDRFAEALLSFLRA